MAIKAAAQNGVNISLACRAFEINETSYRYSPTLCHENGEIADWLERLAWAEKRNIRLEYIQPGKPQQSAYIERYNRTVRGEWLGQFIFETIEEAQDQATEWLWTYNNERPNMGLGGNTLAIKLKTTV